MISLPNYKEHFFVIFFFLKMKCILILQSMRESQIVNPHLTKWKNPDIYKKDASSSIESKFAAVSCKSLKESKI